MRGDFSVRIETRGRFGTDGTFHTIIECFNKMAEELDGVETLNLTEEERMEYVKGVTDGSRRLANMMASILKHNRLENQQIYPHTTEINLGEQLCGCLVQYENIWEKAGIEIDTDISASVMVMADGELLSLVWSNLFSNAFKFTESGGKVTVTLFADEAYAVVKVQDNGLGLALVCETSDRHYAG